MTDLSNMERLAPRLRPLLPDAGTTSDVVTMLVAISDSSAVRLSPASKLFTVSGKQSRQPAHFLAIQVHVPTVMELEAVLFTIGSSPYMAVCNGRFPGLPVYELQAVLAALERGGRSSSSILQVLQHHGFQIAPQAQQESMAAQQPNRRVVARTSESTLPTSWLLLDRDVDAGTPDWAARLSTDEWVSMLAEHLPGLDVAPRLETSSSSSRVFRGGEPLERASGHVWVRCAEMSPEALAVGRGLARDRLIVSGRAWSQPDKNGRPQIRLPVDQATWTSCQMVYCGKPQVTPDSGLEVRRASFLAVNADGPSMDLTGVEPVDGQALLTAQQTLRPGVKFNLGRGGRVDVHDLSHDTLVELEDGSTCELRDAVDILQERRQRGETSPKLRVQSPLRPESRSMAAWIGLANDDQGFLCDSGLPGETHWVAEDPADVFLPVEAGRESSSDPPLLHPDNPMESARELLRRRFSLRQELLLIRTSGDFYMHSGPAYVVLSPDGMSTLVWHFLDRAQKRTRRGIESFSPRPQHVKAVIEALGAVVHREAADAPCWLNDREGPDPHNIVSMANGLLDVSTRELIPHTPTFFNLNTLPFEWDPTAKAPNWEAFLRSIWPDDSEAIQCLQEIFGYVLTADTRQQKIFVIIGPKRSGKGTLGRVLVKLLGEANVASPTMTSLTEQFGLQQLIGKQLALISDARAPGRDQQTIVERLLTISGEDSVSVNRKQQPHWQGRLNSRVILMSNELVSLGDASNALVGRMVLLKMTQSFYGQEDIGLGERLLHELPGIFVWALEGLSRLHERGRFKVPTSSEDALAQLEELNSPIGAFLEELCELGPRHSVPKAILFSAWKNWCDAHGRPASSLEVFAKQLMAACPNVQSHRPRKQEGSREQRFLGVGLRASDVDQDFMS